MTEKELEAEDQVVDDPSTDQPPLKKHEEVFEISLRILGNEFIGMKLSSESKYRNWAVFGLITLVFLVFLGTEVAPVLVPLLQ